MRRAVPPATTGKLCLGVTLLTAAPTVGGAQGGLQDVDGRPALQSVDTSLGARYRAGGLHRFLLGTRYRALWSRPVRVTVLDLGTYAGGLRPLERVGDRRSRSLHLLGADGRAYLLRPADPYAGVRLSELEGTLVERLFQDQISAVHPFGPLVADRLSGAIGLPRLRPRLMIVADDQALGEFREEFAGTVGYLQERPAPGFAGFREVIGTEALLELRREGRARVDVPRYLAARVLDLLLGDWDRHRGQWRWGREDTTSPWRPIPRDRDAVFSEYDGLLPALAGSGPAPHLVRFRPRRLPVAGLIWSSRDLDRELLTGLEWVTWDSVVRGVQARLGDVVIDSAAAEMPAEVGDARRRLAATLRNRRDRLSDAARRFYLSLAAEADLHATDAAERITVTGTPHGAVRVELAGPGRGRATSRLFEPSETREVRVFAHGGADTVVAGGEQAKVRVRVIGGEGDDALRGSDGPNVRLYQDGTDWRPVPREGDPPLPPDWGGRTTFLPVVGANSDAGLVLGATLTYVDYGFRKLPFASRTSVKAAFGTTSGRPGLAVATTIQTGAPPLDVILAAKLSGVDVLRLYQPGNESVEAEDRDFHLVRNWQVELGPSLEVTPVAGLVLGAGPRLRYVESERSADRLIGLARPYGAGGFGLLGARAYARLDLRDLPTNPRRGLLLELGGEVVPRGWDNREAFTSAHAALAGYLSAPKGWSPMLYVRAGARRVWGRYPWFEAARVGGSGSLRGYSTGRFMGDAAVYGQTEVRVPLSRATLIVPGTVGVFGLADVGRVFLEGESSSVWHAGFGGGIWFTWLGGSKVASLAVARGAERTTLAVRVGAAF
ncbi:MAG TPA: hypothetical protein VFZ26_04985 [Gemmatimonadales bacterium]